MRTFDVSLVPKDEFRNFSTTVKIAPKKLYDMTLDLIHPLWSSDVEKLDEVCFVYQPANTLSGSFEATIKNENPRGVRYKDLSKRMVINLARIRTYRDLVYTVYHEWRHALQLRKYGFNEFYEMSLKLETDYTGSYLETDADSFAFRMEDKLTYKNFVINPACNYSIFVGRKVCFKAVF
jgi:hypothetical protein